MKKYIFLNFDIRNMGGVQCYLAGKASYLESIGWDVVILFGGTAHNQKSPFPSLRKYSNGRIFPLIFRPGEIPRYYRNYTIDKCLKIIGNCKNYEEIIIETGNDAQARWGEIIASKIGAKHIFTTMNEEYRNTGQKYEDVLDFYKFKYLRGEILGGVLTFRKLFSCSEMENYPFEDNFKLDEAPIQEVECQVLNSIQSSDWNICYLGRFNKTYVSTVIAEVGSFAKEHPDKSIQFILVGNTSFKRQELINLQQSLSNLVITELGQLVPIPKQLYEKIDVMIAGSGSARHSVYEGKPVIVPDIYSCKSLGILGYETNNSLYDSDPSKQKSISQSLEDVLVNKVHLSMPFIAPPPTTVESCTKDNFKQIYKSSSTKEYFPESRLIDGKIDWRYIFSIHLYNCLVAYFPRLLDLKNIFCNRK